MRYAALLITILTTLFFSNCSKKDLPQPNTLNALNTPIYQQTSTQTLTPPCAADLAPNKISYSYSPSGSVMYFTPQANEFMGELDIVCSDYSTYNKISISLPYRGSFVGTIKYPVNANNQLAHSYNSGFYYAYYTGYEGDIYAEYSATKITLSFCDVKVKDSYGYSHTVKGQISILNNF